MHSTTEAEHRDLSKSIAVMGGKKEATPLEMETFLQLLASITKRILTEAIEPEVESKAS